MVTSLRVVGPAFAAFIGLLSTTVAVTVHADDGYQFDRKVPTVLVHSVTAPKCNDSAWLPINSGAVTLTASSLTITGPAATPSATCTPKYYALSQDRPPSTLVRPTSSTPFIAPALPVSTDNPVARPIEFPYLIVVK